MKAEPATFVLSAVFTWFDFWEPEVVVPLEDVPFVEDPFPPLVPVVVPVAVGVGVAVASGSSGVSVTSGSTGVSVGSGVTVTSGSTGVSVTVGSGVTGV